jgi:hypothetical protein
MENQPLPTAITLRRLTVIGNCSERRLLLADRLEWFSSNRGFKAEFEQQPLEYVRDADVAGRAGR